MDDNVKNLKTNNKYHRETSLDPYMTQTSTTLHFFGDSWPAEEGEIDPYLIAQNITPESYPSMVSRMLDIPYQNHSVSGTSQHHMIHQVLSADMRPYDHAIFSLTSPSRRMYYDETNNAIKVFYEENPRALNDYQDSWSSANACFVLYYLCKKLNVYPWFIATFNATMYRDEHHPLWDHIPDDCWLLPKNQCLAQTDLDPEFFSRYEEYRNCDFFDWLETDNDRVQLTIRPCLHHPNLEGKKIIAERIALELRKKFFDTATGGVNQAGAVSA